PQERVDQSPRRATRAAARSRADGPLEPPRHARRAGRAVTAIRPAAREDLDATVAMLNEHSRRLHGADDVTPSDLLQYWESPDVELGQDVLVAENDEGIVGYADVGLHGEHVWLNVRATDDASLPPLLLAIENVAAAKLPEAALMGYTSADDTPRRDSSAGSGYELVRHSYRMRIALGDELSEPDWPEG